MRFPYKTSSRGVFGAKVMHPLTSTYVGSVITKSMNSRVLIEARWKQGDTMLELLVRSDMVSGLNFFKTKERSYLIGAEIEIVENHGPELRELVGPDLHDDIVSLCTAYRMGLL